ncbi:uncharacterized protein LACBIDRAFT_330730 [Laccaria bicolor S238N-H82]|uniref:Predicted protein n=1 Tax=Laccaria bicolor (strain S238N-H82 / ATCC MYA-4686) TaxID=486041 RepID=B0DM92_LACBS|nr:uncharacterized protein LACBIDRAFT_330730 [Laccaria bicolor S238N-H82]EDR04239.1 predicted protein [Laccaria bicolor S238N-H82]|eukprot:XP_001885130.1 predicted protein [Laccaria bicolor S238N-H82]
MATYVIRSRRSHHMLHKDRLDFDFMPHRQSFGFDKIGELRQLYGSSLHDVSSPSLPQLMSGWAVWKMYHSGTDTDSALPCWIYRPSNIIFASSFFREPAITSGGIDQDEWKISRSPLKWHPLRVKFQSTSFKTYNNAAYRCLPTLNQVRRIRIPPHA